METARLTERDYFLHNVTVLYDTREKQNFTLLKYFAHNGIKVKQATFKSADYSFEIDGKDYRGEWLGERKASVAELYGNVMASNKSKESPLRNNLEEECQRVNAAGVKEFVLFVEGIRNLGEARHITIPKAEKQGRCGGQHVYNTLMSWQCNNRYGFKIMCRLSQAEIAAEMLSLMYYYWRNEMKATYGDGFLKVLNITKEG